MTQNAYLYLRGATSCGEARTKHLKSETRATWIDVACLASICYFMITWYMGLGVAVTELDFTSTSLLVSSSEEEDPE